MAQSAQTQKNSTNAKRRPLQRRFKAGEIDGPYLILVCVLVCFGLVMLISASTPDSVNNAENPYAVIIKYCLYALIGFAVMLFLAFFKDYSWLSKYAPTFFWISIGLMVLVPIIGVERYGAKRWLGVGGFTFQPSEVCKIALIIFIAQLLSQVSIKKMNEPRQLVKFLCVIVAAAGGAVLQSHLSGAVMIVAIAIVMLIIGGLMWKYIISAGILGVMGVAALIIAEPYRMNRIFAYRHPEQEPLGYGWQIFQSLYAICSGGLFGLGLGQSRQKYAWLPMASNDYIFAVICEELGMIGGIVVLLLFGMLIWRGIIIAMRARDKFGSMLAFGITAMIGLQVLINIGVVINVLPSTGMQLPFFSSGGTSLIITMAAMGIMLNVSRYQKNGTEKIKIIK